MKSAQQRVVVVGSLNLDTVYRVRSLPRPGETISATESASGVGGKGGNQAIAAAAAGATTHMVGCVGTDDAGELVLQELRTRGVSTEGVLGVEAATGSAQVVVAADGENHIVLVAGANEFLSPDRLASALAGLQAGDLLLLQNEVPEATNARAAELAHAAGATVVWNAAPAPATTAEIPPLVDVIVVNEGELKVLASRSAATSEARDIAELAVAVARGLSVQVVCTLGERGALVTDGSDVVSCDAPSVVAVDTTAAGDTFTGYYAAFARDFTQYRLAWAAAAGARAVTRHGASSSIPRRADVEPLVSTTIRGMQ